jgi:hypothetical protein
MCTISLGKDIDNDNDRNGFHVLERAANFLVGLDLPLDLKVYSSMAVFARVIPPRWAYARPTVQSTFSTVPALMGCLRGVTRPSQYCSPKTCRMGTRSSQVRRYGSILCSTHNASQRTQCLSRTVTRLLVMPDRIHPLTVPRLA